MRRRLSSAAAVALTVAALLGVSTARASWASSATAGPLTVTSAILTAASGLSASNGACVKNKSIAVNLSWSASASPFADGYEIFRSNKAGGAYTILSTVPGAGTTTYTDATTSFRTTYYYKVETTRYTWRSPASNVATVTTFRTNCR